MINRNPDAEFPSLKNLLIRYLDQVVTQLKRMGTVNIKHDEIAQWKIELQNISNFDDYEGAISKFKSIMNTLLHNLNITNIYINKIVKGEKLTEDEELLYRLCEDNLAFMSTAEDDIAHYNYFKCMPKEETDFVCGNAFWRKSWDFISPPEIKKPNASQLPLANSLTVASNAATSTTTKLTDEMKTSNNINRFFSTRASAPAADGVSIELAAVSANPASPPRFSSSD